jgi:ElaB/YqjD/DUF883 family membrane-anchored ribosome-binding protein
VLIERLEALVANGRKLPFTESVIIDQADALEYIDQLRVTIPEEVKSARRVTNEVERLLETEADEVRRGADDYASEVLVRLESEVMRTLKTIKHGLEILDDRRAEAAAAAAAAQAAVMDSDVQGEIDEYDESDAGEPVSR